MDPQMNREHFSALNIQRKKNAIAWYTIDRVRNREEIWNPNHQWCKKKWAYNKAFIEIAAELREILSDKLNGEKSDF